MSGDGRMSIIVDGSGTGYSCTYFSDKETYFSYQKGATNNEAEYNAVILALEHLADGAKAAILSDSQLVVNQLAGIYRCNYARLNKKRLAIQSLISAKNLDVVFKWIPREENLADAALRRYVEEAERKPGEEARAEKIKRLEAEAARLREENARLRERFLK